MTSGLGVFLIIDLAILLLNAGLLWLGHHRQRAQAEGREADEKIARRSYVALALAIGVAVGIAPTIAVLIAKFAADSRSAKPRAERALPPATTDTSTWT